MCMVSQVSDYGQSIPPGRWTYPGIEKFRKVIEVAEEFDAANGEPDCVDPEKQKLMDKLAAIELRLGAVESGGTVLRWMIEPTDKGIIRETVEPYNTIVCSSHAIARVVAGYLNDE